MRPLLYRLLAVALCCAVGVHPCFAAVRGAQVQAPGTLAPNAGLPVRLPLRIPGSASLGLTGASCFGLGSTLPQARIVAPALTSVAVQPLQTVKPAAVQAVAPMHENEVQSAPIKGEQSKTFAEKKL